MRFIQVYMFKYRLCAYLLLPPCKHIHLCVNSRLYRGASVGQCEAEPEGVHQENSVSGHPAAQFVDASQPWQWGTLMP